MPHSYLHVRSGKEWVEDPEGAEFDSIDAARAEAVLATREIMSERVLQGRPAISSCFEITDAEGRILLVLPFKDAVSAQ